MMEDEFTLSADICHLNHAAVAPWPQRTVTAVARFAQENAEYGSRHYERWLLVEQALRGQLQTLINARSSDEIALLKNTSEALSIVAWGMDWKAGDIGATPTPETAIVERMNARTRLVSLSSVQYSSGLALDLVPIGTACRQRNIAFCVDAIQSLGAKPFDAQACHADFVVADGHKWMLGPEGLALFYCRREWFDRLSLRQFGWHMVEALGDYNRRDWEPAATARRFECGSPNMLGIHALHASLTLLLGTGIEAVYDKLSRNISYLIEILVYNGCTILSQTQPERRAGIVTFERPGVDTRALYEHLQNNGVLCALRGGGIRFSPHFYTPSAVLDRAVALAMAFE
jgi:cysteine desulfurase/selenocysteine lyase